ncbi:MAG: DUF1588 domain-containing protein [Polyangiaceae bacterium]|nr:DUF1588 domain-containing protein [Polyangiaceae bacterium]
MEPQNEGLGRGCCGAVLALCACLAAQLSCSVGTPGRVPASQGPPPGSGVGPSVPSGAGGEGSGLGGGQPERADQRASGNQLRLRLLTRSEYLDTVSQLFGSVSVPKLPDDTSVAGFRSIGSAKVSLSTNAIEAYAAAARSVVSEVFRTDTRWRAHVGCEPTPDLTDACTAAYIARFGRLAYRRALTPEESMKWIALAVKLAAISGAPAPALSELTASMLQSPNFLYRVERAVGDGTSPRYKFQAYSVATRLAFILTGAGPSDALLTAAEQGALDTPISVRQAAEALLADPRADKHLAEFFLELAGVEGVELVGKSAEYVTFNAELRSSLLTETQLFVQDAVLGPGADALSFFDSSRTYINESVAALYGVVPSGAGFQPYDLPPESGRTGILGKASFLAAHAGASGSSPTKRGVFILQGLMCQPPPSPPPGVDTSLAEEPSGTPRTTRMKFEDHQAKPACAGCHAITDSYGFALEHFDAIGRYRITDNGLPVNSATVINGTPVNGLLELAALLRTDPETQSCLARRFYRYATATAMNIADENVVNGLAGSFAGQPLDWRKFIVNFAGSEAFLSTVADTRI